MTVREQAVATDSHAADQFDLLHHEFWGPRTDRATCPHVQRQAGHELIVIGQGCQELPLVGPNLEGLHLIIHREDEVRPARLCPCDRILSLTGSAAQIRKHRSRHLGTWTGLPDALGRPFDDVSDGSPLTPDPVVFGRLRQRPRMLLGELLLAGIAEAAIHGSNVVQVDAVHRVVAGHADHEIDNELAVFRPVDVGP